MKSKYKPKVGDTVRVVESRGKKATKFIGKQGKIVMNVFGGYIVDVGDDVYNCIATKVEPVEKKQLPSEKIIGLSRELKSKAKSNTKYKNWKNVDFMIWATLSYLDEQHIAGRESK